MHEHDEWVRSQVLDQERLLKQKGEWWKEWNAAALILIAAITALATLSVVAGLDAGIRRLSEFNLYLAIALIGFVVLTVFWIAEYFSGGDR